jgi:hypothetical protein
MSANPDIQVRKEGYFPPPAEPIKNIGQIQIPTPVLSGSGSGV